MRAKEAEKKMTKRIEVARAPAPLEAYVKHFDALFVKSNQRDGFRRYMEGLLLPSERHKRLSGLMNTEPVVGAQLPRAQALQWFLSEADWDERKRQESRLQLLREDPTTAYRYRFFNPGRGHVPEPGVFVFFDVPFPFAFSSSSKPKVWTVSGVR